MPSTQHRTYYATAWLRKSLSLFRWAAPIADISRPFGAAANPCRQELPPDGNTDFTAHGFIRGDTYHWNSMSRFRGFKPLKRLIMFWSDLIPRLKSWAAQIHEGLPPSLTYPARWGWNGCSGGTCFLLSLAIYYLLFVICYLLFTICYLILQLIYSQIRFIFVSNY